MTDPQYPGAPTPPPAYSQNPGYGQAPANGPVPGRTLGIVAFVLAFFFQLVSLILGIVALVQSRKAGASNGWAVAAIILSAIFMIIGIILGIMFFGVIMAILTQCAELGPGTHVVEGVTFTCS